MHHEFPLAESSFPRSRALMGLGLVSVLAVSACGGDSADANGVDPDCEPIMEGVETIDEGTLTVMVAEHPPFAMTEGDELTGIEGDLLVDVADSLCLELDYSVAQFAAIIEGLQQGRADISSNNWAVDDERRELFEVSDALYSSGIGIVTQGEGWSTAGELDDASIGIPQGYLWLDEVIQEYGAGAVSEYQDDVAVLNDIQAGRIDAGLVSLAANTYRLTQDQYEDLTMEPMEPTERIPFTENPPYSVALIQKGNTELRDAANVVINEYYESGELEAALEEYGLDPETAYPENR